MRGVIDAAGNVRVCQEMCSTCVFRPGNLMHLTEGRLAGMVADASRDQSFITCHKTLDYGEQQADPAICRGYWDTVHGGDQIQLVRIAQRLGGGIVEVDLAEAGE